MLAIHTHFKGYQNSQQHWRND